MRSRNVGELDGISLADDESVDSAAFAALGSGLTCLPKTSRRLSAVPSGVQVTSVISGALTGSVRAETSVGLTTLVLDTVYV